MHALLIGFSTDATFRHTVDRLQESALGIDVLDLARLAEPGVALEIVESARGLRVTLGERVHDFAACRAFHHRARWQDLGDEDANARLSRLLHHVFDWLEACDGTVVNRPVRDAAPIDAAAHQHRAPGATVRVHWVGGRLFSERLDTQADCDIPPEVARLCYRHCESRCLMLVAFDFAIAADGCWTLLAADPLPAYEDSDRRHGHRIARALADLLASGAHTPHVPPAHRGAG